MNKDNLRSLIEAVADKDRPVTMSFFRREVGRLHLVPAQIREENSLGHSCGTAYCIAGLAALRHRGPAWVLHTENYRDHEYIAALADYLEIQLSQAQDLALPLGLVPRFSLIRRSHMVRVLELLGETGEVQWKKVLQEFQEPA